MAVARAWVSVGMNRGKVAAAVALPRLVQECQSAIPEMNGRLPDMSVWGGAFIGGFSFSSCSVCWAFGGQNLANTSWALATLRVADDRFFESVAKAETAHMLLGLLRACKLENR